MAASFFSSPLPDSAPPPPLPLISGLKRKVGGRLRSKRFPDAEGSGDREGDWQSSRPVDTLDIGEEEAHETTTTVSGTTPGQRRSGIPGDCRGQHRNSIDNSIIVVVITDHHHVPFSISQGREGRDAAAAPANRLFCAEDIYSSVSVWSFVRSSSLGKSRARAFPSEEGFLPLTVSIQSGATILDRGWVWDSFCCFNSSFWGALSAVHAT